MQKADQLIRTKLRLPFTRPDLVSRPRLHARISDGLCGPLTLITAPAGFGKTTLVASCIIDHEMPVAWLSLDKRDNQVERFLDYFVAAVQEADQTIGDEAVQILSASQHVPAEIILTSIINDLDSSAGEIVLVLDDYQFISSQAVHETVVFLLDHCPRTFHLVISTRSDPPVPISRLRARGQVVELRATDLRFTKSETAQFLNDIMGLGLDSESVAALEARTEGWIAGLQMAALSMRDRKDVHGFLDGFSGTNRYILDYLLEEVLANQPPEIQRYLLCTSILERLTAPLCDAVLATDGIPKPGDEGVRRSKSLIAGQSAAMLEHLERANLFLVPLDDERLWYRYHHLFSDLLRARLDQIYPGLEKHLHGHAAAWFEREGMMVEAINHALAAGAYPHAVRMVEENTGRLLSQGELNALMGWIEMLPAELRLSRPSLCVHQAMALMFAGRATEVRALISQAESALEAAPAQGNIPMTAEEIHMLRGLIATVRAYTAVYLGRDEEALSQGQLARELLPVEDFGNRSVVAWAIGRTLQMQGRLDEARMAFEDHVRLGRASGHLWGLLAGLTALGRVLQVQGHLQQAHAIFEEALTEASKAGGSGRGYIAWVNTGLASLLYKWNELEAAKLLLSEAVGLIRKWPNPNHEIYAYTLQARVLLAQGDLKGARNVIGEADQIRKGAPLSRWIRRTAEAELVRVWLALQESGTNIAPADPLVEQSNALMATWRSELMNLPEDDPTPMDECDQIAALTLARVSIAAGRSNEALHWLKPVTKRAKAAGYIGAAIEALALTAIVRYEKLIELSSGTEQLDSALTALEDALTLAEPSGYIRVFLSQGLPMRMLLAQWLAHAGDSPLRDYAVHLLSQFNAEPDAVPTVQEKISPASDPTAISEYLLVEPLSQRELEVLQNIALGKTNKEIAKHLIIAPGTVKAHTSSIYRKLDVTNRTEAVARARQLGILS